MKPGTYIAHIAELKLSWDDANRRLVKNEALRGLVFLLEAAQRHESIFDLLCECGCIRRASPVDFALELDFVNVTEI